MFARTLCWSVLLFTLAACAASAGNAAEVELFVLGTAQDGGLPHFGCEKPCCVNARASGRVLFPVALGVIDRRCDKLLLVEATPRIEQQVAMLHELAGVTGRGRQPVDAVLTTHAHLGHYLGLAWFGREVAGSSHVPVHCSPRFAAFLRGNGPWKQLVELDQIHPREFVVGDTFEPWPGITVQAVAVPHRDEYSDTMAFVIRGPNRAVLFVPDIDAWEGAPAVLATLLGSVDGAYLDGTFFDGSELPERDLAEIRHPPMVRTMELLAERAKARPGTIRFIHLNHTNPALHDGAVRSRVEAAGFRIAQQGERIAL